MHSITEVVAATGVTSRTLRHYDAIGLLPARRDPCSGYRSYSREDLVRLQRILLLRALGLGLPQIAAVLGGRTDDAAALRDHLQHLAAERERLDRQIASVERTIEALRTERNMTTGDMFDGFDHTQYADEVVQRWGEQAYADSDRWWRSLDDDGRAEFMAEAAAIGQSWEALRGQGVGPEDPRAQDLAARHVRWIRAGWGGTQPSPQALEGLAQMYVDDERFAATYGGRDGAQYVRDALVVFARSM